MSDLVFAYAKYFGQPNKRQGLLSAISDSKETLLFNDALKSKVLSYWERSRRHICSAVSLKTSGTLTGVSRSYKFGPCTWIDDIERLCKYPHNKHIVCYLKNTAPIKIVSGISKCSEKEPHFNFFIWGGPFDDSTVEKFIYHLENILRIYKKIILWANSNVFLYLTASSEFSSFLISHIPNISLLCTGQEPFFKKKKLIEAGVYINDNMINWENGLNFYTCRFNNKHCLPIFALLDNNRSVFLLNSGDKTSKELDDMFIPLSESQCRCGKKALKFKFIPHVQTAIRIDNNIIYNPDLADELVGRYQNLQFIKDNNKIFVHYWSDGLMPSHDSDVIRELFPGVDLVFKNRSIFSMLDKSPIFYSKEKN